MKKQELLEMIQKQEEQIAVLKETCAGLEQAIKGIDRCLAARQGKMDELRERVRALERSHFTLPASPKPWEPRPWEPGIIWTGDVPLGTVTITWGSAGSAGSEAECQPKTS